MAKKLFTKRDMIRFQQDVSFFSTTKFAKKYKSTLTQPEMIKKWFEEFEEKSNKQKSPKEIINKLYFEIIQIYESDLEWEKKYNEIFSDNYSSKIRELLPFDYYDPDMDYQDDVNAYVTALKEAVEKFNNN